MKNDNSNDALIGQILKNSFADMEKEADFSLSPDAENKLFSRLAIPSPYATPPSTNGGILNFNTSAEGRRMVRSFYYSVNAMASAWKVIVPIAALVIVIGGSGIYIKNNGQETQAVDSANATQIALMGTEGEVGRKINPETELATADSVDQFALLASASRDWAAEEGTAYESGTEEAGMVFADTAAISRFNANDDEF